MNVVQVAAEAWLRQFAGGLGPLLLLGALLFLVQRWTQLSLAKVIGWRGIVYWTGWIGTPIHELSHLVVGKLFGVRITEYRLFSPDPASGVLGFVRYRIPRLRLAELPQIIGTFLMGVAPLFGGALALIGVRTLLVDPAADEPFWRAARTFSATLADAPVDAMLSDFLALVSESYRPVVANADVPWIWLYVYVSIAIGAHLAPSSADLKGGLRGLVLLLLLGLAANVVAVGAGADPARATETIARLTAPMSTLLGFALALNVVHGAVAFGLASTKSVLSGR